jgi:hypothetical protein
MTAMLSLQNLLEITGHGTERRRSRAGCFLSPVPACCQALAIGRFRKPLRKAPSKVSGQTSCSLCPLLERTHPGLRRDHFGPSPFDFRYRGIS